MFPINKLGEYGPWFSISLGAVKEETSVYNST